jgi:hypothetical protein
MVARDSFAGGCRIHHEGDLRVCLLPGSNVQIDQWSEGLRPAQGPDPPCSAIDAGVGHQAGHLLGPLLGFLLGSSSEFFDHRMQWIQATPTTLAGADLPKALARAF